MIVMAAWLQIRKANKTIFSIHLIFFSFRLVSFHLNSVHTSLRWTRCCGNVVLLKNPIASLKLILNHFVKDDRDTVNHRWDGDGWKKESASHTHTQKRTHGRRVKIINKQTNKSNRWHRLWSASHTLMSLIMSFNSALRRLFAQLPKLGKK